jgi:hypothetical protein
VKLVSVAIFGAGYVLGTKAGRDRYEQIMAAAQNAPQTYERFATVARNVSQRLEEYGNGGSWSRANSSNGSRPASRNA